MGYSRRMNWWRFGFPTRTASEPFKIFHRLRRCRSATKEGTSKLLLGDFNRIRCGRPSIAPSVVALARGLMRRRRQRGDLRDQFLRDRIGEAREAFDLEQE